MASIQPFQNPSGEWVVRVQFRLNGKSRQETFRGPTAEKAGAEFGALVDRVGAERALQVLERRRGNTQSSPTFAQWVATYLDPASGILTGIQPGTRHGYQRIAERALIPFFGEYPIDSIGRDDIGRWVQWIESQPSGRDAGKLISAKTVANYRALLSNVFKAAADRSRDTNVTENPVRGIRLTAGQSRVGVFLSPDEFARILAEVPEFYRPFVVFLANTGCRWGEATAITWRDVELASRPPTVHVNKAWKKGVDGKAVLGPPKSKAGRRSIPLSRKVLAYLPARGAPGDLVFVGRGGGRLWYGMFNSRIWKPAVERADVGKSPNIHDLRHTYASWLLTGGATLTNVQRRLGHEKIETTVGVYGHLAPGADFEVLDVIDRAMGSIPDPVHELTA